MCVQNRMGFSAGGSAAVSAELPLETCDTIAANGVWGHTKDHKVAAGVLARVGSSWLQVRSLQELVSTMIRAAGRHLPRAWGTL